MMCYFPNSLDFFNKTINTRQVKGEIMAIPRRSIPSKTSTGEPFQASGGWRIRSLDQIGQGGQMDGKLNEGRPGGQIRNTGVSYTDIGGLDELIAELDLVINGAEKYPELWTRLGRKRTRGVLLSGPPGCGKTLLAQALANQTGRKVCLIQGSEIKGWRVGASEGNLKAPYEAVRPNGILIIDEIDAIGGKRDHMVNETERSIVSTLCSIMDGAGEKDGVTFIATTNKPHMLDPALRRHGRFDVEIVVLPPDEWGRKQIFQIHTKSMPLASDVDLEELAKRAHGFTGADIAGVCAKLSQKLLQQAVAELKKGQKEEKIIKNLFVGRDEFCQIINDVIPSLIREGFTEVAKVKWTDIGGLEAAKRELQRVVIWPLKYAELIKKMNLRQPKGLLLFGPPGCGKTLLAKAVATESDFNFLAVNGPALLSKWVGNTEEAIRDLFWKAHLAKPCIIFLDEAEALAPVRGRNLGSDVTDRAVSQLLAEIDGAGEFSDVFIIAATNRADLVDPALLRPGRLDLQYEISLPDAEARAEIIKIHLRNTLVKIEKINIDGLVEATEGRSGAMVEWMCTSAKRIALERHIQGEMKEELQITASDFQAALEEIKERKY